MKSKKDCDALFRQLESEHRELMRTINRRSRRKSVEEDGRRNSGLTDEMFLQKYREIGSQTGLAVALGISQPAARKRLNRIIRERQEAAGAVWVMLQRVL